MTELDPRHSLKQLFSASVPQMARRCAVRIRQLFIKSYHLLIKPLRDVSPTPADCGALLISKRLRCALTVLPVCHEMEKGCKSQV